MKNLVYGKPVERRGRKVMGLKLRQRSQDCQMPEDHLRYVLCYFCAWHVVRRIFYVSVFC
jgi:hypothetical protein